MIKKIKIISLVCISVLACGKDKNKDNAPESLINVNDSPRKVLKTYIKSLRAQYNDDWHKILSALERDGVWELDYEDKKILLNNRANIERDLKEDQNLLNYFYRLLQTSSLEPSHDRDTLKFTAEKARLKQELYDDMANIAEVILNFKCPILADVEAMYSLFFSDKEEQKKFFADKDKIGWFGHVKAPANPENKDPFDCERYPLIFDKEKYKILEDELNEQIWKNFISIVKNVQPIRDDQMDRLKSLEKDRYVYDEHFGFPITSGTEAAIVAMCKNFGIHFSLEGGQSSLVCHNSCGLLSSHSPFCFLGHQIVGLTWAIMNTALTTFPIEKINASTELCLDLEGLFSVEMARSQIKLAVRNSLFAGVGFYFNGKDKEEKDKENHIEEWGKGIDISQNDEFVKMNGFATMDYRYAIDFLRYDCFDIGNGRTWGDLKDITNPIWTTIKALPAVIPENHLQNPLFTINGLQPAVNFSVKYVNFVLASFAALHSMIFADPKQSKTSGYYFFDFKTFEKLVNCLSAVSNLREFSEKVAGVSPTDFNQSPWKNICLRKRESQEDFQLYVNFCNAILKPLYQEYSQHHEGSKGYVLDVCKKISGGKNFETNGGNPNTEAQNYFFTIIFRTYEAIGTYCLLDSIFRTEGWIITIK